ncbi:hypothetical protein HN51_005303 [Arachis hypogaea]
MIRSKFSTGITEVHSRVPSLHPLSLFTAAVHRFSLPNSKGANLLHPTILPALPSWQTSVRAAISNAVIDRGASCFRLRCNFSLFCSSIAPTLSIKSFISWLPRHFFPLRVTISGDIREHGSSCVPDLITSPFSCKDHHAERFLHKEAAVAVQGFRKRVLSMEFLTPKGRLNSTLINST